jgi:hypothetical protein
VIALKEVAVKRASSIGALFLIFCAYAAASLLSSVSVTCTGEFNSNYTCGALIDGVTDDTILGPGGTASYWLGREYADSYTPYLNETFTLDLGYEDLVTGFNIFNTRNGQNCCSNDRGTLAFTIWLSSVPVVPDTSSSSFGTPVLVNTALVFYPGEHPNTLQPFTITPTFGRYVTFRATDVDSFGSAGLSEIQVEGTTPEPATFFLAGIALAALAAIRRRN